MAAENDKKACSTRRTGIYSATGERRPTSSARPPNSGRSLITFTLRRYVIFMTNKLQTRPAPPPSSLHRLAIFSRAVNSAPLYASVQLTAAAAPAAAAALVLISAFAVAAVHGFRPLVARDQASILTARVYIIERSTRSISGNAACAAVARRER